LIADVTQDSKIYGVIFINIEEPLPWWYTHKSTVQ